VSTSLRPFVLGPVLAAWALALSAAPAAAQSTSTGTLTVTATVESSISLTFESIGAGVALTGAGTNAATLAFGTISAYNTIGQAGVTRTLGASDFTVSSPFGARVVKANSTSANYTLAVALASTDAVNTWRVNSTTLTTTNQNLGASYAYASTVTHTLYLTVPFSASSGAVNRVLNFTATAN